MRKGKCNKVVNLTGKDVTFRLLGGKEIVSVPAKRGAVTVNHIVKQAGEHKIGSLEVPIYKNTWKVRGLPKPVDGVIYLVVYEVMVMFPDRKDLFTVFGDESHCLSRRQLV